MLEFEAVLANMAARALAAALTVALGAAHRPSVKVGNGTVVGTVNGSLHVFAGITYATAPRFAPPVAAAVEGTFDASRFGPACLQWGLDGAVIGDEECLTLNVFAPAARAAPRAVMVFIHGGGLTSGAATTYDFKDLATQGDLVVVSIQYRLSSMGWLAVPGAVAANNAGLWDQIAALRWVHDHIAGFGGDAARVTIFGQSAGGTSVLLLASSPPAKGLFARAIAESPWWASNQIGGAAPDVAADVIWGDCWCDVVNCSFTGDALGRELRAANATELVEACYVVAVVPDGVAVPAPLMDALCAGDADPFGDALDDPGFEMIVGSNHDEYRYWLMGVGNASATEADIADELVGYVGRNVLEMNLDLAVNRTLGWTERCRDAARDDLLRRIYAAYAGHSPFEHAVDFTTDFWFTVPTALAASTGTRARRARYLFQNDVEADTVMPLKTMHCTELPYVLGFEGFVWRYNSSDEDAVRDYFHAPTKAMRETKVFTQDLWIDFAKRGFHDDTWPAITSAAGEPHARLRGARLAASSAPVTTRAGFDVARDLYCELPKLREAYLRACLDGDF